MGRRIGTRKLVRTETVARKPWHKFFRNLISKLPRPLRLEIIRRQVDCLAKLDSEIVFKMAQTQDELKQAFALVHDAYSKQGFVNSKAGIHMIPQHLLSSTVVLIAKRGNEVLGTLTVVRRESFGLPGEKIVGLDELNLRKTRLAEITCLAVKDQCRRAQGGAIFFHLMKYMYEFSTQYLGVQGLVAVIHPKDVLFYESLLCFDLLTPKPVQYMGAPAVLVHLNLVGAEEVFRKTFDQRIPAQNLYQFFVKERVQSFQFPNRKYVEVDYSIEQFQWLSKLANKLGIIVPEGDPGERGRHAVGTEVIFPFEKAQVLDVSKGGIKISLPDSTDLNYGTPYMLILKVSPSDNCSVVAELKWVNDGIAGFQIKASSPTWKQFLEYLDLRNSAPHYSKISA